MLPPIYYLKKLEPFSFLTEHELDEIVRGLESEIYEKGSIIFKKGGSPLRYLYLLKCGKVSLSDTHEETMGDGELFGVASVLSGNPPGFTAIAEEESVCYLIRRENFLNVFNSNPNFSDFFEKILSRRLTSLLRLSKISHGCEELYAASVIDLITKEPVVCSLKTKIRDAAIMMNEENVGSIIIVDEGKPLGIFTQKDLIRVIAEGISREEDIGKYMSSPVIEIDENGTVMEAYLLMVSRGINHLVVLSNGRIKGVISNRDILLRLESFSSLLSLSKKTITLKQKELKDVVSQILDFIEDMCVKINFSDISRIASGMYDLIIKKILMEKEEEFKISGGYCWIQTGGSGRMDTVLPEVMSVIILKKENKKIYEFIDEVSNTLREIGFEIEVKNCYTLEGFRKFRILGKRLELYDSRFLYGDKDLYLEFNKILKDKINRAIKFSAIRCLKESDEKSIVHGIRALSLEAGAFDIKNTEGRCRFIGKSTPTGREIIEAYNVIMDIDLRKKFAHKPKRIDEILLKESKKIVSEFKKFIKQRYAV